MRTITVPAGIGDFLWLAAKLLNTGERFNIIMPNGSPQRGHQVMDLLPDLVASHTYAPNLSYEILKEKNMQSKKRFWRDIGEKDFYLSANLHLETGNRIEDFFPDLETSYRMKFTTSEADKIKSVQLLPGGPKYIGIYGSAYRNARHKHYNGWGPGEWFKLIRRLYNGDEDFVFVIIGAEYDSDLATMLMEEMRMQRIPFVNTIGQPLSTVVEILKQLKYFIGFPSGLSILNEYMGKNGLMFYGHKITGIINSWADPERIRSGDIKECLFDTPEVIYNWLANHYKIFDR